jgi:hypothetical protein
MKGTDGVRAIFNGKRFSSRCATPPPTNLPDINVLFAALLRLPGKITMVEGDVRHFFHQIKLHYDISRFFCIRMHQKFWRWATLPMGWSWSPFIAQSISFGVIIETLSDCGESVSMYRDLHVPPSLIEIPGRLVAAVWYDNILLATNDANLALRFYQKLKKLTDKANLEMKEWNIHHPRSMMKSSECMPTYLGMEFAKFPVKRSRHAADDTSDTSVLHWRHW